MEHIRTLKCVYDLSWGRRLVLIISITLIWVTVIFTIVSSTIVVVATAGSAIVIVIAVSAVAINSSFRAARRFQKTKLNLLIYCVEVKFSQLTSISALVVIIAASPVVAPVAA